MTSQRERGPWHPSSRGAEAVLFEISTIFSSWQRTALEKFQMWFLLVILESTSVEASHWKIEHIFPLLPFSYEKTFFLRIFHWKIKIHFLIITANTSFKWGKLSSDRKHKTVQHICTDLYLNGPLLFYLPSWYYFRKSSVMSAVMRWLSH